MFKVYECIAHLSDVFTVPTECARVWEHMHMGTHKSTQQPTAVNHFPLYPSYGFEAKLLILNDLNLFYLLWKLITRSNLTPKLLGE